MLTKKSIHKSDELTYKAALKLLVGEERTLYDLFYK